MPAKVQQAEHKRKIFFFKVFLEAFLIHIFKGNLDSFRLNILSPSTTEIKGFQSSFDKTVFAIALFKKKAILSVQYTP